MSFKAIHNCKMQRSVLPGVPLVVGWVHTFFVTVKPSGVMLKNPCNLIFLQTCSTKQFVPEHVSYKEEDWYLWTHILLVAMANILVQASSNTEKIQLDLANQGSSKMNIPIHWMENPPVTPTGHTHWTHPPVKSILTTTIRSIRFLASDEYWAPSVTGSSYTHTHEVPTPHTRDCLVQSHM